MEAPRSTFKESREPRIFFSYMALMRSINEYKPSTFREAKNKHVWRDDMAEEYKSIMKNGVYEIVLRLEGKLMVTSRWIYKIKYVVDGNVEKYKVRLVTRSFS